MDSHLLMLVASLALGTLAADRKVPTVDLLDCQDMGLAGFDECLTITSHYDSGDKDDVITLNRIDNDSENLEGSLQSEPNSSRVSLTINGSMAFIVISRAKNSIQKLTFNLDTKATDFDDLPSNFNVTFPPPVDAPGMPPADDNYMPRSGINKPLPKEGFHLSIFVLYDLAFQSRFGNQAEKRVNAIMNHVKTFFRHPSLGTTIEVSLVGKKPISETWRPEWENLGKMQAYVRRTSLPTANAYVLLSSKNDEGGISGRAYFGTICKYKDLRISINEYLSDDISSALIVAHEVGHNLGMTHDFKPDGSERFASDGTLCTGVKGFMDYYQDSNQWSRCSAESFQATYQKYDPFCLSSGEIIPECNDEWTEYRCNKHKRLCGVAVWFGKRVSKNCRKTCSFC